MILRPYQMKFLPAVCALMGFWASLTPSLLPRTGLVQAVVGAASALVGYGIGALLTWMLHGASRSISPVVRTRAWYAFAGLGGAGTIGFLVLYARWQSGQRSDIGSPAITAWDFLAILLITPLVFALFLIIARAFRALGRLIAAVSARILPVRIAISLATVVVVWLVIATVNSVVVGKIGGTLDEIFYAIDDEYSTTVPAPTASEVSGSAESYETWEELGRQGRVFITNTPSAEAISSFSGEEALQPIRVYIGAHGEDVDLQEQAELAVAELERTGAFDRAVLNVATGTGRGWINENSARALEYMWNGDTATVSMQYSYLPSWMSFLVDGARAQDAGRLLFDAVYARWVQLPESERPLLVVSGESLGSFGGEAAFSGAQDIAGRTDGVLWVGPSANNRLWNRFTDERDTGTPIFLPTYQGGATIRFSNDGEVWPSSDCPTGTCEDWEGTRVGYLQHANDPMSWSPTSTFIAEPDYLKEEHGPGVPDAMVWMPIITGFQVLGDMVASDIPDGQGHQFGQSPAVAWSHILPPDGWTDADTNRLVAELAETELTIE